MVDAQQTRLDASIRPYEASRCGIIRGIETINCCDELHSDGGPFTYWYRSRYGHSCSGDHGSIKGSRRRRPSTRTVHFCVGSRSSDDDMCLARALFCFAHDEPLRSLSRGRGILLLLVRKFCDPPQAPGDRSWFNSRRAAHSDGGNPAICRTREYGMAASDEGQEVELLRPIYGLAYRKVFSTTVSYRTSAQTHGELCAFASTQWRLSSK